MKSQLVKLTLGASSAAQEVESGSGRLPISSPPLAAGSLRWWPILRGFVVDTIKIKDETIVDVERRGRVLASDVAAHDHAVATDVERRLNGVLDVNIVQSKTRHDYLSPN